MYPSGGSLMYFGMNLLDGSTRTFEPDTQVTPRTGYITLTQEPPKQAEEPVRYAITTGIGRS